MQKNFPPSLINYKHKRESEGGIFMGILNVLQSIVFIFLGRQIIRLIRLRRETER